MTQEIVKVTAMQVGEVTAGRGISVQFQYVPRPGSAPAGAAPLESPTFWLSLQEGRQLLLLLGQAMGLPGTGIAPPEGTPRH